MSRSAWRWLFTLGVLLVGAYFAWTHEAKSSGPDAPVVIVDLEADALDRASFATDKREVVVEAKTDTNGRYYLVTLSETPAKKADDAKIPAKPTKPDAAPEAPAEKIVRRFTGGRAAKRLFDRLAPLTALRTLANITPERLKKLGLDPPEATFTINRGERRWSFGVGGKTFGGSRRYLHEEGSDKVYLVEATALRNLEGAERQLLERSVVGAKREELTAVTATSGASTQQMIQQNRADRRAAYWAFAKTPDEKSAVAGSWVDKLFRLRVDTFVDAIPESAEEACHFVAKTESGQIEVTLHRAMGPKGKPEIYALSSSLRLPVKVYQQSGEEVIDDIATLFAE